LGPSFFRKATNLKRTKMKKTIRRSVALFTSLLLITSFSQAQSCLKWITDIGGNNDDGESEGKVIAVSNGFIVCGKTNSNNPLFGVPPGHGNDAYVAKYDVNGNIAWRHIYGGSGEDFFNSVIQTADGGFIAAGHTSSNDGDVSGNHGGNGDAWVVKISADGTLQWQKCYGGSGDDIFFRFQPKRRDIYLLAQPTPITVILHPGLETMMSG
jgi:hypothetical protein